MADLIVTPANVLAQAGSTKSEGIAGESITAGETIYKASATGKIMKADASDEAGSKALGVALNNAALNQPVDFVTAGKLTAGAAVDVGTVYAVSATAGGICPVDDLVAEDYVTILGVGVNATTINLTIIPSGVQIPDA